MVVFEKISDDKKALYFRALDDEQVRIKIVDGYTGLCTYMDIMEVSADGRYFFMHPQQIYHKRFEILNIFNEVYLRVDTIDDAGFNIQRADIFNVLKNLKYYNTVDKQPGLPLYEIFLNDIYTKGNCRVEEHDTVFDVGGNIGLFSYYSICRGAKEVYCFEPSPVSAACVRENFKFSNLFLEEVAVSNKNGKIEFFDDQNDSICSSMFKETSSSKKIICDSVNLIDYIKNKNIKKVNYLKLDCEGAEYDIIESLPDDFLFYDVEKICVEYHMNTGGRILPMINKLKLCGFDIEFQFNKDQVRDELGIFYACKK